MKLEMNLVLKLCMCLLSKYIFLIFSIGDIFQEIRINNKTNMYLFKDNSNNTKFNFTKYIFILNFKLWQYYFKVSLFVELRKPMQTFHSWRSNLKKKFPYSIQLVGVGMLFAITGWVLSIAMYYKLRKQQLQSLQDQNLNEVAETFPEVPQDQYMAETAYTSITGSLDKDFREGSENINQCFTRSWCDINFIFTRHDLTRCWKYCI